MHYPIPYPYTNRLNTLLEGYTLSPLKSGLDNGVHYNESIQGSLYYILVRPVFEFVGGISNLSASIGLLRLINLLLVTAAVVVCLVFIGNRISNRLHAALIGILICSQPLYILNCCRVANDPLAVALGTFVIALVLKPNWEKNITVVILVGVLTGLAFWAKLTNSTLILFIMICLTISVLKKSLPLRNAAIVGLVVVFICALINVPSFLSNLHRYGTLTTMQESLLNRENKATFLDLLSIIWKTFLPIRLMSLWLTQSTWFGGWSFLKPPVFKYFITLLLMASLSGWGYYFVRKTDTPPFLFSDSNTSLQIFVLILCLSAGISWFMIQTYIAWKITGGSAWYAAVVFPFALMFICEGACRFSHKFGVSISILLILSYILIEFYSIVHIMLPVYSGGLEGFKAIYQISTIQPLLLGTGTLFISASILFVVYALTLLLIFIPASKRLERAL